jgi:hypothetical protein
VIFYLYISPLPFPSPFTKAAGARAYTRGCGYKITDFTDFTDGGDRLAVTRGGWEQAAERDAELPLRRARIVTPFVGPSALTLFRSG